MSWKKHFTPVKTGNNVEGSYSPFSGRGGSMNAGPAKTNYSSYLPDVYVGSPNRVERYGQYNTMDNDSEVNAALDILAEFCTQQNTQNKTPFLLDLKSKATNSEVTIIGQYLQQWSKLQNFETRMFRILRNTFKYGDAFFVRDPETKKLFHVDPGKLTKIIVNESEGKTPEQYVIKDFNLNFGEMVATTPFQTNGHSTGGGDGYLTGGARGMVGNVNTQNAAGGRFQNADNEIAVDAQHMIHLSLSEGLDMNYPFGNSLLETVFKVYKQKELLEDAIIIYRVQRAPERRVFYVDVGNMPSHLAMQYFTNKLVRGLRIPSSYLPTGADDASSQYNDGRVGTAYIQELRFNTYCERLQNLLIEQFNQEFKRYILEKGVNIDTAMFDLRFQPPQNFASYRQSEIDNARVPTYTQMSQIPYISNRFAMKRFLGMTDEELAENERLWREENDETLTPPPGDVSGELRGAGISSAGIDADLGGIEDEATDDMQPDIGADATAPETQTDAMDAGTTTDQTV